MTIMKMKLNFDVDEDEEPKLTGGKRRNCDDNDVDEEDEIDVVDDEEVTKI